MKRVVIAILGVAAVALLLLLLHAYLARPGKRILFTWSNSLNSLVPDCSTTVTKRCISGLTLTDATAAAVVSSTISPSETTYTYSPPGGIPIGYSHTFTLVTNAIDSSGVAVSSVPATVTVTHSAWHFRPGFRAVIQY
jgi:hypothetical protein